MKNIVYIVLFLALMISALVLFFARPEQPATSSGTTLPETSGGDTVVVEDEQVLEPVRYTSDGVTVQIPNPLNLSTVSSQGDELYNLTDMQTYNERSYNVIYNNRTKVFTVALLDEPLADSRIAAKEYIQSTFGLSDEELCLMPIHVLVPYGVNQFLSGESLGMPGCPGSFDL